MDISVFRKLTDDNPLLLTTRLVLAVSGKSREVLLGRALPDGFEAQAVESELPLASIPTAGCVCRSVREAGQSR